MSIDTFDALRVAQNSHTESTSLQRQLHIWLGLGSAGGALAVVSLATSLPDPAYALEFFLPSLWAFLVGVVAAGGSIFFLALRVMAFGQHHASAHNRESLNDAIRKMPETISSPRRIADNANRDRNKYVERSKSEHLLAEQAWNLQLKYRMAWAACLIVSAVAFVFGFGWPLTLLTFFARAPISS